MSWKAISVRQVKVTAAWSGAGDDAGGGQWVGGGKEGVGGQWEWWWRSSGDGKVVGR